MILRICFKNVWTYCQLTYFLFKKLFVINLLFVKTILLSLRSDLRLFFKKIDPNKNVIIQQNEHFYWALPVSDFFKALESALTGSMLNFFSFSEICLDSGRMATVDSTGNVATAYPFADATDPGPIYFVNTENTVTVPDSVGYSTTVAASVGKFCSGETDEILISLSKDIDAEFDASDILVHRRLVPIKSHLSENLTFFALKNGSIFVWIKLKQRKYISSNNLIF